MLKVCTTASTFNYCHSQLHSWCRDVDFERIHCIGIGNVAAITAVPIISEVDVLLGKCSAAAAIKQSKTQSQIHTVTQHLIKCIPYVFIQIALKDLSRCTIESVVQVSSVFGVLENVSVIGNDHHIHSNKYKYCVMNLKEILLKRPKCISCKTFNFSIVRSLVLIIEIQKK